MASFNRRCYQWLQQYAQISGQQELMTGMRNFFSMIQQPANMKQLEAVNRKIYDEFSRQFAAAQAKAKQRGKTPTPKT